MRDVARFHEESVSELRAAFEEAVDDDLQTCSQLGHAPNHSDSGQFRLRLEPELHARAALAAERQGKSLNARVAEGIARNVASP